ncbi:MAG: methylated-DNA--[protein]-cysteine S-methyltransferase [Chloroflexi bacterium]|nr:methylated-DNA--[protein]-cysteine S-methyltransferase [Chloroflexota bacterium]
MDDPVAIRSTLAGPWGPVHVAATARGVVAVEWQMTEAAFDETLARRLGGRVGPAKPGRSFGGRAFDRRERHLAGGVKAIEAFLAGRHTRPDVAFDLADRPAWDRRVLGAVAEIPWGHTASYAEVARRIGAPGAARAVGGALGRNPISFLIPCHRVIAADGTLGGWGGDRWGDLGHRLETKRNLLLREGVTVAMREG